LLRVVGDEPVSARELQALADDFLPRRIVPMLWRESVVDRRRDCASVAEKSAVPERKETGLLRVHVPRKKRSCDGGILP
jgi:hypothetical protein